MTAQNGLEKGILYILATPIGNLQDITLRAIEVLKMADFVLCEDTRVTAKLLGNLAIKKSFIAYHQHSGAGVLTKIGQLLEEGKNLALVSDAGTPGINDPGGRLISDLIKIYPDLKIVPIPGANAGISALSVSGFPVDEYIYKGFVPNKKGRQTFMREIARAEIAVVFYESKYRIIKTLEQLAEALAEFETPNRPIIVARELTKAFETIYRGSTSEVLAKLNQDKVLGEFVVVVAPRNWKAVR